MLGRRVVPNKNPILMPVNPRRRMEIWWVVQKGDLLWNQVTGTPTTIDRSVIEATARVHGYGGAYRVQPANRLVTIR